jgi:serine/threonine protein kinase
LPRTRTWRVVLTKIEVECPQCSSCYKFDVSEVGQRKSCKQCDTTFIIHPALDDGLTQDGPSPDRRLGQSPQGTRVDQDDVPAVWNVGDVILDLYEVSAELGAGGMGKVLKVHHKGWNLDVAVKSPLPELMQKPGAVENFERECETWVSLDPHPHTVSSYYVRRLGGIPRIFAEFVAGGDLKRWIKDGKLYQGGPNESLKRILDIAIQFAWGLQYAHAQGLIHQDVKPANVMMMADGTAKVTDFGLAKARAAAGEPTSIVFSRESILVSAGGLTPAYCRRNRLRASLFRAKPTFGAGRFQCWKCSRRT